MLVLKSPEGVQSEISACFAILALADDLKEKLLKIGLIDVLIPLTFSENGEVCGNAAAALANLCSRLTDYKQSIKNWEAPSEGIGGFLRRFLNSQNPTFEHIALWTILQLLESEDGQIIHLIREDAKMIAAIKKLADENFQSTKSTSNFDSDEQYDDPKAEMYNLTQRILQFVN